MAVEPWPTVTVGDKDYWEVDIKARVPKEGDPNAEVLFLVGTPNGGVANVGPLVKGDPGVYTAIDTDVDFTPLDPDDTTPDSMSFTVITPPNSDTNTPGLVRAVVALHKGAKGEDGNTVLDPGDFDGIVAGQTIVANGDLTAFVPQTLGKAAVYWPATINDTAAGNPNSTLGFVALGAVDYDRLLIPFGYTIITGTGSNVAVDLYARLNGETGGNIIGSCHGIAGPVDRLMLQGIPDAGSASGFNKVNAGATATVHMRTERQSGTDTYITSHTTTRFGVLAAAI